MDRYSSVDEDSGRQAGKVLAAAPTGGVGPGVVANHDASLFQAPKTLLQVATETLSGKANVGRRENEPAAEGRQQEQHPPPPSSAPLILPPASDRGVQRPALMLEPLEQSNSRGQDGIPNVWLCT